MNRIFANKRGPRFCADGAGSTKKEAVGRRHEFEWEKTRYKVDPDTIATDGTSVFSIYWERDLAKRLAILEKFNGNARALVIIATCDDGHMKGAFIETRGRLAAMGERTRLAAIEKLSGNADALKIIANPVGSKYPDACHAATEKLAEMVSQLTDLDSLKWVATGSENFNARIVAVEKLGLDATNYSHISALEYVIKFTQYDKPDRYDNSLVHSAAIEMLKYIANNNQNPKLRESAKYALARMCTEQNNYTIR